MSDYVLCHYGVKGMKWGVRKKISQKISDRRKKTETLKQNLGEERYNEYRYTYGKKGAERIYNRTVDKQMTYKQAERRELGRQFVKSIVSTAIGTAISVELAFPGITKAGAKYVENKIGSKFFNTAVLDVSGKVIKRYNTPMSNGLLRLN